MSPTNLVPRLGCCTPINIRDTSVLHALTRSYGVRSYNSNIILDRLVDIHEFAKAGNGYMVDTGRQTREAKMLIGRLVSDAIVLQ